jgi:hypothetical protein
MRAMRQLYTQVWLASGFSSTFAQPAGLIPTVRRRFLDSTLTSGFAAHETDRRCPGLGPPLVDRVIARTGSPTGSDPIRPRYLADGAGPPFKQHGSFSPDSAIMKTFQVTEGVGAQFRVDIRNVTNSSFLQAPDLNFNRGNNVNFGRSFGFSHVPKTIQMGLRVNF